MNLNTNTIEAVDQPTFDVVQTSDVDPSAVTLEEVCAEAVERGGGDFSIAIDWLHERITADGELRDAICRKHLRMLCREEIYRIAKDTRKDSWESAPAAKRAADSTSRPSDARVLVLAASNLMTFPLPGTGKPLGDAVKSEIVAASYVYKAKADDMRIKYRWLELIVANLKDGRPVCKSLTEERLAELKQEAKNAA